MGIKYQHLPSKKKLIKKKKKKYIYIYIYRYIRKILIRIKLLSLRCKNLEKGSKTLNDVEGQFELWVTCSTNEITRT